MKKSSKNLYNNLAHVLYLLGIEEAAVPAALSELQDCAPNAKPRSYYYYHHHCDDGPCDGDGGDDDDTALYFAAAGGDARDIRACGCEWDFYGITYHDGRWMDNCAINLIVALRKLGVIRGDEHVVVGGSNIYGPADDDCGAW